MAAIKKSAKSAPQKNPGARRAERHQELIKRFWPGLSEDEVWQPKAGFAQIPRAMPIVLAAADALSGGQAVSKTYLDLWCRSFDQGFVNTTNQMELPFSAGFTGQRARRTWLERMKRLEELKFIKTNSGPAGEISYCLLRNPYKVLNEHHKAGSPGLTEAHISALLLRMQEVGESYEWTET
jgi:hypothetical protein